MNNEAYSHLEYKEIITKDHYCFDDNDKLVLLPSNHPWIGEKAEGSYIYEKVSLDDFRTLKDDEIVNEEHFYVRRSCGHLVMYRCYRCCNIVGHKADDVRKENSSIPEFNLYAKKTQFNFGKFDFLKDIEL
jgi:hypothetical protein